MTGVRSPKYFVYLEYFDVLPSRPSGLFHHSISWLPGMTSTGMWGAEPLHEGMRGLEFAVPGALAQIARDDGGGRAECREERLQRLGLGEVGVATEVEIGEVGEENLVAAHHQTTRTR